MKYKSIAAAILLLLFFTATGFADEKSENSHIYSELMFGHFDKRQHGVIWHINRAPHGFEEWANKRVISKQLVNINDTVSKSSVVIFYTNKLKSKNHTNPECHACKSLISVGIFREKNNKWHLIDKNIFLKSDGSWGSPPDIKFVRYQSDSNFSLIFSGAYTSTGSSTSWSYKINFFNNRWEESDKQEETINMETSAENNND